MEQNITPDPEPVEGDFPATAEEVQPLVEERYRVVGTQPVFGWKTGEEFNATFAPEQKEYYLTGGHLKVVTDEDQPEQEVVQASVEVKPDVSDESNPQE